VALTPWMWLVSRQQNNIQFIITILVSFEVYPHRLFRQFTWGSVDKGAAKEKPTRARKNYRKLISGDILKCI
jgi:hypothetical protein